MNRVYESSLLFKHAGLPLIWISFFTPAYLQEEEPAHTRQWIVWHVLEHEIHHRGELSQALGTYGLDSFYTW